MNSHPDAQAIDAIRNGDIDRYRELIERYERQAFGIAWARLGDAALAEEVVQETFIKAYRHLGWLRDPRRFGAWLGRIARSLSINLGLRHRRELRRRERWSLDATAHAASGSPDEAALTTEPVTSETLREALAALPNAHREALVLHYLEGRPVADSAATVGVSEGTFKVRLHRARSALRLQLELRLESSLGRLGPRRSLAPGIMSTLAAKAAASDPAGVGSGLLAGLGATLAKVLPVSWAFALIPLFAFALGLGSVYWIAREERRNFRDPDDIRVEIQRKARRRGLYLAGGALVVCFVAMKIDFGAFTGLHALAAVAVVMSFPVLRHLQLNRSPAMIVQSLGLLVSTATLVAWHVWKLPIWVLMIGQAVLFLAMAYATQAMPSRFDHNLYLRAWRRMLPPAPPTASEPSPETKHAFSRNDLMRFGRLLGPESLVTGYRRGRDTITFALTPVTTMLAAYALPYVWPNSSVISLGKDGSVSARLGRHDRRSLRILGANPEADAPEWERQVTRAVTHALEAFVQGETDEVLRRLGQQPSAQVFKVDPRRSRASRLHRAILIAGAVFAVLPLASKWIWPSPDPWARYRAALRPVSITVDEARTSVAGLHTNRSIVSNRSWREMQQLLSQGLVCPPVEWARPEGQARVRQECLENWIVSMPDPVDRATAFLQSTLSLRTFAQGWITPEELTRLGITSDTLHQAAKRGWGSPGIHRVRIEDGPVQDQTYRVLGVVLASLQCAVLDRLGCSDLVDREAIVTTLAAHQVIGGRTFPSNRNPNVDRKAWDGLFATAGWSPLQETHAAIELLGRLGALDRIDREACVRGLLRFHQGQGRFAPPRRSRDLQVVGDARDTYAVWDSLRLLDALDRVPDLDTWEFRPSSPASRSNAPRGIWTPNWTEIEAVIMRERFDAERR